ncbi:MAG: hypothetical protein COV72_03135 [Candidatus Omnitrophica bacterium CG11_big_fil_rev_8_21_14_0_20_42_13]|uniref:Cohesin domain-containing protein n=1 Tax=Candidatus Ghiorseimicrobium undicola TaxID=1974746 RepID=A0A2H0LYB3_9BACT|nr:MAG: hypothetical protein COV72_03135 [Candidatus Omnitrophica bacterium CG11_big_fil_rev_8_21_14_0_20_42_13]
MKKTRNGAEERKKILLLLGIISAFFVFCPVSEGATLAVGEISERSGAGIIVPVILGLENKKEDIFALSFDFDFDSSALSFKKAVIGPAANDSAKILSYSEISAGKVRILIFGLNANAIPEGGVADMIFEAKDSAPAGIYKVSFSSAIASDNEAGSAALSLMGGEVPIE